MQAVSPQMGFADPAIDAQRVFRCLLKTMSEPGLLQTLPALNAPPGIAASVYAVLLSLCDRDTPIWLSEALRQNEILLNSLRFHCASRFVEDGKAAVFALGKASDFENLEKFACGNDLYPDTSTTLIVQVDGFDSGPVVTLSGPGIADSRVVRIAGLSGDFWQAAQRNQQNFPLGVDFIFCHAEQVMALPRSTRIGVSACM